MNDTNMQTPDRAPLEEAARVSSAAAQRIGCPTCGGQMRYDIASRGMLCVQCGTTRAPREMPDDPDDGSGRILVTAYRCPQCGAEIVSAGTEATSFCSYCGSDVILEQRLAGMQRPARIVPFAKTREDCEAIYREHLKKYPLAPAGMRSRSVVEHFRPVYIPFWSYHVSAKGQMDVWGTERRNRSDETVISDLRLTVDVDLDQKGILYDASRAFEDETAARLEHKLDHAVRFRPCYLSGMYAQAPDARPEFYHSEASAAACQVLLEKLMKEYKLDSVSAANSRDGELPAPDKSPGPGVFRLPNETVEQELVLMPVWLLAHRRGGRMLYAAINGDSGTIVCDVPVSAPKVAGVTLLAAVILYGLMYLLPVLRPDWLLVPCLGTALIVQYMACSIQRRLIFHSMREDEPAFFRPVGQFGPAGRKLTGTLGEDKTASRSDVSDLLAGGLRVILYIVCFLGLDVSVILFGLIAVTVSPLFWAVSGGVLLLFATAVTHFLCFRLIRWIPACREKNAVIRQTCLSLLLDMLCTALLFCALPQDIVYYSACALLLMFSIVAMIRIWRWHNRYTTRPVPFFDGEEETT
ncbi:MAG: zinc ribbon domain-containing protein [Clostridia bacterium]|nr:zinc ribbon domain-containing protein [Clostridia bacterium]